MEAGSLILYKMAFLVLLALLLAPTADSLNVNPAAGCQPKCGDVEIPFPFGIGEECYRGPGFQITCLDNTTPVLGSGSVPRANAIEVLNIYVKPRPEARVMLPVAYQCYDKVTGDPEESESYSGVILTSSVYRISKTHNELVVLGCNTLAYIYSGPPYDMYYAGCVAHCNNSQSAQNGACDGVGCCRVDIPLGLTSSWMQFMYNKSSWSHANQQYSPCDYAFIVEKGNYTFQATDLHMNVNSTMPLVLDWAIRDLAIRDFDVNSTASLTDVNKYSCAQAPNRPDYACVSDHSVCVDSTNGPGYVCNCTTGYWGNPYLENGCTNINECSLPQEFPCFGECHDTEGSYSCKCRLGYSGDPSKNTCTPLVSAITLGVSLSVVAVLLTFIVLQKRKIEKLFEKNGGKILQNVKGLTIFSKEELKKITKNNSEFLGNGRFGKVYKGTLADNSMVAVKASIKVNEDTKKEFAEEVEIHTHMIHKNILKLIGCCLEVDVPMLVYEFAANGSLQETLHGNKSQKLSLDLRLDIAIGSAEGLRYMHSFTTQAIRHGDVKPDNILLDDRLTPKVSDFGLSKLLKEEYFVKTVVGCMGYIDPVFMKTGLLTQKSDVYSFGAVLLELITGKKNVYDENLSLIIEFCKVYEKEKSGRAMFDGQIIATEEDIPILEEIGKLAIECLKEDIKERPDMTEVAERLVILRRNRKIGKTQNRGPHHFVDVIMDDSMNNTDLN